MSYFDPHLIVYAAIFFATVLAAEAAFMYLREGGSHARVNKRMKLLASGATNDEVLSTLRRGSAPSVFTFAPSITRYLETRLTQAGLRTPVDKVLVGMMTATIVVGVLFPILAGATGALHSFAGVLLFVLVAGAVGVALPIMYLSMAAAKRVKKFEEQFPVALDIFVRGLRAGYPVTAALELLVSEVPDPIGSEFGLVVAEMNYGYDLREGLVHLAQRIQTQDAQMFVVSVSIQAETGGNLADILDGLGKVIRDRASMVAKVRALAAEGKMTGMLLAVLPVLAFLFLMVTQPRFYLDVIDDRWFLPGAIGILAFYMIAMVVMKKMIAIKV